MMPLREIPGYRVPAPLIETRPPDRQLFFIVRLGLPQVEACNRIARLGSFRAAARRLNLTQPTVSARIPGLEAEFGNHLSARGRARRIRAATRL